MNHEVVVTGVGLVSSAGVGNAAHLDAMCAPAPQPVVDSSRHAPMTVHPTPEIDWNLQIPRREQRQMELWQKLGVYGAGLALEHAGIKDNAELCKSMDMIIAASGGERDLAVDAEIIARVKAGGEPGEVINAVLTTELRPTLFLAQLSNLLAGNISIVHKVTGSSRTFMGEESAGVSALKIASDRIRAGQSTHALVGASYNGEDADYLLSYALEGLLKRDGWQPVWARTGDAGLITGSGAAFLVIESHAHAQARGATILAVLGPVHESRNRRPDAQTFCKLLSSAANAATPELVISGASGHAPALAHERAALALYPDTPVRAFGSLTGHMKEAQFLFAAGLAALCVAEGRTPSPVGDERAAPARAPVAVLAEMVGILRGEGAVMLRKPEAGS
ncbi:MAG: beta-ketoacyl-ACP synthase [Phyllobacteriaceae bacterium]|nr:beta-ketoacyl-ACP synthase [Phyllobacteriaceae bacterium]